MYNKYEDDLHNFSNKKRMKLYTYFILYFLLYFFCNHIRSFDLLIVKTGN